MHELVPGLFHWTAIHPKIHVEVSSYYWEPGRVLIDPLLPRGGLDAFEGRPLPQDVILVNRHHYRHSAQFEAAFGCTVWCNREGLHEFTQGEKVRGFTAGEPLPGGLKSFEIGALCPDETAVWVPAPGGALAIADGVIRLGSGELAFVPDELIGDGPERVKRELRAAYAALLSEPFEHLLFGHGLPLLDSGKLELRRFAEA